jgi:hypothetical protein
VPFGSSRCLPFCDHIVIEQSRLSQFSPNLSDVFLKDDAGAAEPQLAVVFIERNGRAALSPMRAHDTID